MNLLALEFRWSDQRYRAVLTGRRHVVSCPAELPLRSLRDALCACLYGAEHFPGGARGGLRDARLTFEVNGIRYRAQIDLTTGRRDLLRLDPTGASPVADGAGSVNQTVTALLNLPSPLVYRSLTLATVDFPGQAAVHVPEGLHRALLAYATDPTVLDAELEGARRAVEEARSRVAGRRGVRPWRDPYAAAGALLGVGCLVSAWLTGGDGRYLGLAGPPLFGVAAWRALEWIDDAERLQVRVRAVDEAEAVLRARRRQWEDLRTHLEAVERTLGTRNPEAVHALLSAQRDRAPDPEVVDHVDVYAGGPPPQARVDAAIEAFGIQGVAAATAGLVLAAMESRGARPAPLFWMIEGDGGAGVTWFRVFDHIEGPLPLLVFSRTAGGQDRAVRLEAVPGESP